MPVPISRSKVIMVFVIGSIFGLLLSLLTINKAQYLQNYENPILRSFMFHYNSCHAHAHGHEDLEDAEGPDEVVLFHEGKESVYHKDEDGMARELAEKVKVLCWVMTQPNNHKSKVKKGQLYGKFYKKQFSGPPCEGHLGQEM